MGRATAEQLDGADRGAKLPVPGEFEVTAASAFDASDTQLDAVVVYLKCFARGTSHAAHMYESYGEERGFYVYSLLVLCFL